MRCPAENKRSRSDYWTYVIALSYVYTAQKRKFSITDFFSKSYQIRSLLRIWSHLPKKSLMANLVFFAVLVQFRNSSRSELARITLNNQAKSATGNQVKGVKGRDVWDKFTIDCFDATADIIVYSIKHRLCIFIVVIILEIFNLKLFYEILPSH